MKKLAALLLGSLCVFSVSACGKGGETGSSGGAGGTSTQVGNSTENSAEGKSEFQKILAFVENTSGAEGKALIREIVMANQAVEILGTDDAVVQVYDGNTNQWKNEYVRRESAVTGKISREGLEEGSAYKAFVSMKNGEFYDDGSYLYLPNYQIKSESIGIDGGIDEIVGEFSIEWESAKEIVKSNAQIPEELHAQIGITYSIETIGEITTIVYKDNKAAQWGAEEMTVSGTYEYKWEFDKDCRCVGYSYSFTRVYKENVATLSGSETGSTVCSVKAWNGTVTLPEGANEYTDVSQA